MIDYCPLCDRSALQTVHVKQGYHIGKCDSCSLLLVRNPPTKEQLTRLYSFQTGYHKEFLTNERLQEEKLSDAKSDFRILEKYYRPRTPGTLLDIGCSTGFFLRVARDKGWQCKGVELSKDTARIAAERYHLEVYQGELEEQPFQENEFDVVTLWDVIEHLEDPLNTLKRVARILKPDGIILFRTPNADGLFPRLSFKVAGLTGQWPHVTPPGHLYQFSKRSIEKLLKKGGLEFIDIIDERIPLDYTFGTLSELLRSPKWLLYSMAFAPLAFVGPWLGQGDSMVVVAQRRDG